MALLVAHFGDPSASPGTISRVVIRIRQDDDRFRGTAKLDPVQSTLGEVVPFPQSSRIECAPPVPTPPDRHTLAQARSGYGDHNEHMAKTQKTILADAAANFRRTARDAQSPTVERVAKRVQTAQSDVAETRKRAQVNDEVLQLRLR